FNDTSYKYIYTHTLHDSLPISYPYAIKEIFPNAEIIIDRFHIVQQLNRALNNKRIQVMNEQKNKESRHYTKLKRYWKFVLTHERSEEQTYELQSRFDIVLLLIL